MPNSTVTEQHDQAEDIYRQYEGFEYRRYAGNEDGKKGARSLSFRICLFANISSKSKTSSSDQSRRVVFSCLRQGYT